MKLLPRRPAATPIAQATFRSITTTAASVEMVLAEVTMLPKTFVKIDEQKKADQMTRLMDTLEDHDDVQNVYANFDIPDELLHE